jgi:hypothetical protein
MPVLKPEGRFSVIEWRAPDSTLTLTFSQTRGILSSSAPESAFPSHPA